MLQDDCIEDIEQTSSVVVQSDPITSHVSATPHDNLHYSLNLSFEELSTAGLDEHPRPPSNHWTVGTLKCYM